MFTTHHLNIRQIHNFCSLFCLFHFQEQYELVYKAVKEIVSDELLKQRSSMHTYVNVAVGEEMPDAENTYENVEFIRSIQRLHEEEKNAVRKTKEPPIAVVAAPNKDLALTREAKNMPLRKQPEPAANHIQGKPANHNANVKQKDPVQQPTSKPPVKKKPQSGYENVLPLSSTNTATKPPLVPKPQNYVNVDIPNAKIHNEDSEYVNVPKSAAKSIPVPEKKPEPKPVPVPQSPKPAIQTKPVPPHPGYQRTLSSNGDYVIPALMRKEEKNSDYVIAPNFATKNGNVNQVPEGT